MSLALEYLALTSEVAIQRQQHSLIFFFSTFYLITCSDLRVCYVLRYVKKTVTYVYVMYYGMLKKL